MNVIKYAEEPQRPVCTLLVGLPCSGKTLFANRFFDYHRRDTRSSIAYVSTEYHLHKASEYHNIPYDVAWERFRTQAEQYCKEDFTLSIMHRQNIILDRTNLVPGIRAGWLEQLPPEYLRVAIYFHLADPYKITRINRRIPVPVISRLSKEFQEPKSEEGFDLILKTFDIGQTFNVVHMSEGVKQLADMCGVYTACAPEQPVEYAQ